MYNLRYSEIADFYELESQITHYCEVFHTLKDLIQVINSKLVLVNPSEISFNKTKMTNDSILACRKWFAINDLKCIREVINGDVILPEHTKFNNYRDYRLRECENIINGKQDHTFAFYQRAYYIQTGECLALLP